MKVTDRKFLFAGALLVPLCFFAACAGKKSVEGERGSVPSVCDRLPFLSGRECTPLPQELKPQQRIEAGMLACSTGNVIQYYRLIPDDARFEVVFIHGAMGHASDFRKTFASPPEKTSLTAYDRPGFVRSIQNNEVVELEGQVTELECVFKKLSAKPAKPLILVGHSYGGAIALAAAAKRGSLVAGLVLVAAIVDPAQAGAYKIQKGIEGTAIAELLPQAVKVTNRELVHLKAGLEKLREQLGRLNIPVFAVHGGRDDILDASNLEYLARQFERHRHSKLLKTMLYPEFGHLIPDKNPEVVEAAIRDVISRLDKVSH